MICSLIYILWRCLMAICNLMFLGFMYSDVLNVHISVFWNKMHFSVILMLSEFGFHDRFKPVVSDIGICIWDIQCSVCPCQWCISACDSADSEQFLKVLENFITNYRFSLHVNSLMHKLGPYADNTHFPHIFFAPPTLAFEHCFLAVFEHKGLFVCKCLLVWPSCELETFCTAHSLPLELLSAVRLTSPCHKQICKLYCIVV